MALIDAVLVARWPLIGVVILLYAFRLFRQYYRLRAFKGPWGSGFSSLWMLYAVRTKRMHLEYARINEKYGSLARIGTNTLLTSSPEMLFRMSAARSPYTKGDWYTGSRIQPGRDNVFSGIDEERHTKRRAQLASGYSGKENPDLEHSIDIEVQNFVNLVRNKYMSNRQSYRPMDLARKAQFFTLDVITKIAFGEAFGDLEHDEDMYNYIQSTEEMLDVIIFLGTIPAFNWLVSFDWVAKMAFPSGEEATGVGRLIAISQQLIGKRFGPKAASRQDMIESFIRHGVKEDELVSESLLQVLAGSDTSATVIRATMLYLISHPSTYRKVQEEIDAAVRSGRASSPVIRASEVQELPYLHAVIREGMRIHPSVIGMIPKVVPPEGDTVEIDGKRVFLPGGTNVGYNAWGVHHRKDVFGEDADAFRPERWLEAKGEKLGYMEKTADLAFGWGKYQCLGKNIAWMEINKVFFELLRNFDFAIVDPTKPWKSECSGLWKQSEEWVEITDRLAS